MMRLRPALSLAVIAVITTAGCAPTERAASPPPPSSATAAKKMAESPGPSPVLAQAATAQAQAQASEAPYDLDVDRQRRARKAKEELGSRTITAVVSDIFVVIGPAGWQGEAFERSVALMRSSMAAYMNGRFGKKPAEAISVYLFPNSVTYETFCKQKYAAPCIASYGFYQPSDRYMVMNAGLGLGTLTHEIVHPLVETDFPTAPTWLNEGIASVFEAPVIPRPGEIHGIKNWRHPRLKKALTSTERSHASLTGLFTMSDETFRGDGEDLHYATARYVCQWLDERGKLWTFYQKWRDNAASDPSGAKTFEEILGMTPAAANEAWAKWVLAL